MLERMNYGGRRDLGPQSATQEEPGAFGEKCSRDGTSLHKRIVGAGSGLERDICTSSKLNNALLALRRISNPVSVH